MKTFKELVDSGEWNQARYDVLSHKYTHLLYTPTRNKIKDLFKREALSTPDGMATPLYSMIEMVASKIVQDVLIMLLQDESVIVDTKHSERGIGK